MNTNNLKVGQVVKNYKELCSILDTEPKASTNTKGRKLHHEHFKQYFEYNKEGQKYIITKIYKNAENKIKRGGNNSVYKDDLRLSILDFLEKDKSGEMLISRGRLFEVTKMVNINYRFGQRNIEELSKILDIPKEFIKDFYLINNSKLKGITDRNMLSFSEDENLFAVNIVNVVAIVEIKIIKNSLGKPILNGKGEAERKDLIFREATDEENLFINKCTNEAKEKLEKKYNKKLLDPKDIFLNNLWEEYNELVNKKLKRNNIAFYYKAYKIIYDNDIIEENLKKYEEKFIRSIFKNKNKESINKKVVKSLEKTIKTNVKKAIEIEKSGDNKKIKSKLYKLHSDWNYSDYNQKLIDKLINEKTPIIGELKKNTIEFILEKFLV